MKKLDRNEIVENILAIANCAHSEYHLIEAITINKNRAPIPLQAKVLELREMRVSLMDKLSTNVENIKPLWCLFKHLFLLQFHLFELYEKNLDSYYIDHAQKVMIMIDELMAMEGLDEFENCPRCEEDQR